MTNTLNSYETVHLGSVFVPKLLAYRLGKGSWSRFEAKGERVDGPSRPKPLLKGSYSAPPNYPNKYFGLRKVMLLIWSIPGK